ncbi:MAG: hypothetical protein ACRDAM_08895, partial [Casimicrobium sp.]
MSRPISTSFESQLSAAAPSPGYMVEIAFPSMSRYSTRAAFDWGAMSFAARFFSVSGFGLEGTGSAKGSLTFMNHDNVIGTLCLANGVAARSMRLWSFDGDPPAADSARLIFEGECDAFALTGTRVTISCVRRGEVVKRCPSLRIKREATRQIITRPGTRVRWGGETYIMENAK